MSYDVGTYIDLAHINNKTERAKITQAPTPRGHYDFVFRLVNGRLVAARQIQVAFA